MWKGAHEWVRDWLFLIKSHGYTPLSAPWFRISDVEFDSRLAGTWCSES